MANEIKAGDVVQLKSGGPLMTVHSIGNYNGIESASCMWFEKNKQEKGVFALPMLAKEADDYPPI